MSGTPDGIAIARLEEKVGQLVTRGEKRDEALERVEAKIDAVEAKLDKSSGGMAVLRWLGLGSLGSALAVTAAIYAWVKGG